MSREMRDVCVMMMRMRHRARNRAASEGRLKTSAHCGRSLCELRSKGQLEHRIGEQGLVTRATPGEACGPSRSTRAGAVPADFEKAGSHKRGHPVFDGAEIVRLAAISAPVTK